MYKKFLLLLILPFILIACGDDDEPQNDIFEIAVTEAPQGTETSIKDTECGISTNGEAQTIIVTLLGDFDSFRVTGTIPDWIYTTSSTNVLKFKLSEYNGDEYDVRSAEITFTVYKGKQSVNGRIIIHQYALTEKTYEYLKKLENQAIDFYLKDVEVVDKLPQISDIIAGESAPYYKLDSNGNVYMQVVKMGSAPAATQGERVDFRFLRYNLLYYTENGVLPNSEGYGNDLSGAAFFNVGSNQTATTQWGTAIQMPMFLGLPVDSEVNLVVASEAGPTAEIANVIPFLYNIRYYHATM